MRLSALAPLRRMPSLAGVDLAPGHARLLACSRAESAWRVERCAERELPPQSLQDGRLQQFDAVCGVLRDLVQQSGAGPRVALPLPPQACRRELLGVPPAMPAWRWRRWLREQAERLAGAPLETQALDVQMLSPQPLQVLLTICPREVLEDWQGLAEAAGLELVVVDDRVRTMRAAIDALGLVSSGHTCVLAEAQTDTCRLHVWRPGELVQSQELGPWDGVQWLWKPDLPPSQAWIIGHDADVSRWRESLLAAVPGPWSVLDLRDRLPWAEHLTPPDDSGCYLAAFGLALRAWR